MKDVSGYHKLRTVSATVGVLGLMTASSLGALAQDATFDGGGKIGGDGAAYEEEYTFAAPTYGAPVGDTVYQYATGEDGNAYYAIYEGGEWSSWSGYEQQPVKYKEDPAPVAYNDAAYVTYLGEDGKYYFSGADGEWADISGEYEFICAPYQNVYKDKLYVYGVATDGSVYWKDFDGQQWGEWGKISDDSYSAYEVYAIDWDGYNNVFWSDEEGHVYWNRFDGQSWDGVKQLPNSILIADAVYAAPYDGNLYAFGSTDDWKGAYTVFTPGEGWADWSTFDGAPEVYYQPAAYTYDGKLDVVYTGRDGHGYYKSYDGSGWTDWQDLGGNYAYEPALYEYDGGYYLTYTGEDGYAYTKEYKAGEPEEEPQYQDDKDEEEADY